MTRWFWRRPLLPCERDFVRRYFGTALDGQLDALHLYLRRVGDTRRALSLGGGRISMPSASTVFMPPRIEKYWRVRFGVAM